MVPRVWSLMRFLIKGSVAGGAVYLVYDQELLGPSDKSQAVLQKAEEVVPPAMYQFSQYVCEQTGLKIPQLPAPPKFNFHIRDTWNSGIIMVMSALSVAPSKAPSRDHCTPWQESSSSSKPACSLPVRSSSSSPASLLPPEGPWAQLDNPG
uniref:MICOS complex subunit MIC13 n=1 Tax=Ursus maritimus TaxID=29073 RepID=A0A452U035_URSMA